MTAPTPYQVWIDTNWPETHTYGHCEEAAHNMALEFPALRLVRGHYHCPIWGKRQHWWCETAEGTVIDPTASQFPSKGVMGSYEEAEEHTMVRIGCCAFCGEDIMAPLSEVEAGRVTHPTVCSKACGEAFTAHLNAELQGCF